MNAAQVSLKSMRIIHLCFVFTVILYLWLPTLIAHKNAEQLPAAFLGVFGIVALTSVGASAFFQAKLVRPAAEQLQRDANDRQAAGRWRAGLVLAFVFSETVILSGFVMRILGVPWSIAGIFYAVGALLLLWCAPKLDLLPE
ncbi:MAG TPA: hypothetical protein VMT75_01055 [Candidatus Saccharimonadales bacterium]|nr:hypothetical protein [Candidatus Saccharimonadales bacterium]